jgi:hypothetical protein
MAESDVHASTWINLDVAISQYTALQARFRLLEACDESPQADGTVVPVQRAHRLREIVLAEYARRVFRELLRETVERRPSCGDPAVVTSCTQNGEDEAPPNPLSARRVFEVAGKSPTETLRRRCWIRQNAVQPDGR